MTRCRVALPVVVVALLAVAWNLGVTPVGAAASAATSKCTKKPFVGTVTREAEGSATGQPAASRRSGDFRSVLVYDFGNRKNFTVYLADYRLDPDQLGGTLEAPSDDVLVTLFLSAANGKELRKGTKLVPGKDPVSVIVDAGGGAGAVTSDPAGSIQILAATGDRLCFRIDYEDTYQQVDGVVDAKIGR
jgi:hypothetical protein